MKQKIGLEAIRSVIATGYVFILAIIGGMFHIWINEWRELETLEAENIRIDGMRQDIHSLYVQIMGLSLMGETVIDWNDDNLSEYHAGRMSADSTLAKLKEVCPSVYADSIRTLLADKEKQLEKIMEVLAQQDEINAKIARQVPAIARQSVQEKPKKTKRKGFLGIFGKKEEPATTATTAMLYSLRRDVITQQQEQHRLLSRHADSLAARNRQLNRHIQGLIHQLDRKVHEDLDARESHAAQMRRNAFLQLSCLMSVAAVLLLICYIVVHRNINRIKRYKSETSELISRLETALEENSRLITARRKIMQTITHELRTPLTAIQGYAELIPGETDEEKRERYTVSIRQSVKRMLSMLTSLLDFFRLESGKEKPVSAPFRLQGVADALLSEFLPLAENKDLSLIVWNETDVTLDGDRELVMRVSDNLLSNALKFTNSGSVIYRSSYSDGVLTISVEDTGTGMSGEERQRVFGAFERLSNAATQDGFGLGLSIVSHIVDMLGGMIHLDSEKGKGSRFTITLPMPLAESNPVITERTTANTTVDSTYTVAVLDDNDVLLGMTKEMYARYGIRCDTFHDMSDLMEAISRSRYDLLITDLKMPDMNGYEVLELLRTSNVGNSRIIPVVVATASGSCNEEELIERGFAACLFKPFSLDELLSVSERCVAGKTDNDDSLPDMSSLLAYGGELRMLDSLVVETEKDMAAMRKAVARHDRKALDGLVHHLRSSWAVIRADKPLWTLYYLLHGETECTDEELTHAVHDVLRKGETIIRLAKKRKEELCRK